MTVASSPLAIPLHLHPSPSRRLHGYIHPQSESEETKVPFTKTPRECGYRWWLIRLPISLRHGHLKLVVGQITNQSVFANQMKHCIKFPLAAILSPDVNAVMYDLDAGIELSLHSHPFQAYRQILSLV